LGSRIVLLGSSLQIEEQAETARDRGDKERKTEMDKYEPVREIGAGNFGVAKLMRNKETRELVAMKFIERGNRVGNY